MKRFLFFAILCLSIATGVAVHSIYTMPTKLMLEKNEYYRDKAGGVNRFLNQGLPDATWTGVVRPCPDLMYSYLVFDLREKPLAVEIPGYDDYWVIQMVASNTDNFAYLGHRTQGADPARFVLYYGNKPGFQPPRGFQAIASPTGTGTLLLRYLVRTRDDVPKIEAIRKQVKAWQPRGLSCRFTAETTRSRRQSVRPRAVHNFMAVSSMEPAVFTVMS